MSPTAHSQESAASAEWLPQPLRVAHFITRLIIGGAQENTLLTVEDQYRDHGDAVSLVTGPGLGPEGSLEDRARTGGFPLHILPRLYRHISPRDDWASYRAFVALMRQIQPHVIHTHSGKAGILGRAAASKLKIPVVHTIHGPSFFPGQNPLANLAYRRAEIWAGRRTDHFISVCDAMTDQYVAAGVAPRERFTTIYSGMEVDPFLRPPRDPAQVRKELDIPSDAIVIGKIARLFDLKGHEFLLEIAPELLARYPQALFLFVGDGTRRAEYEQRIRQMGLTDRFRFTGLVPPARIPELVHGMDIVVHTSLREGLARVLPQGLIAGKPIVSYDVDGAREVCLNDITGFLLPPRAIRELQDALARLIEDPILRTRFGQTGREKFTEQFRHQNMTRDIRQIYARILQGRSQHPNGLGRTR